MKKIKSGDIKEELGELKKKRSKFMNEFKNFALKGNIIDLAVGVIIGGAFQGIISSLVNDIIMPLVGLIVGDTDYSNLFVILSSKLPDGFDMNQIKSLEYVKAQGLATFAYGSFISALVNFLIMAMIIFLMVRGINRLRNRKPAEEAEKTTKDCPFCISEIDIKATRCPHCTAELE